MPNTVTWPDPDTVGNETVPGQNPQGVYLLSPSTNKAVEPSSGGGSTNDVAASGTLSSSSGAGSTVQLQLGSGQATWEAQFTGTFSSGTTIVFEGSDDASSPTNWDAAVVQDTSQTSSARVTSVNGTGTVPVVMSGNAAGYQFVRVRCSALHGGDSVSVRLIGSTGAGGTGSIVTNDGTFAKESGGNLASIKSDADTLVTNTTGLASHTDATTINTTLGTLATQSTLVAAKTDLDTIVTNTNKIPASPAQEGGNLATIATNTSNISTVEGATTDAAVTSDANGTVSAKLRGLVKILADMWDSVNHRLKVDGSGVTQPVSGTVTANAGTNLNTSTLALESGGNLASAKTDLDTLITAIASSRMMIDVRNVGGNAIATGNNAVPTLTSAAAGTVAAYGSNAAALTSATDYAFKWGASGTTQVNHVMIQNNSTININVEVDAATNAGSQVLSNTLGQNTLYLDIQMTALHIQGTGTPNVNGSSASNIVIRGWL